MDFMNRGFRSGQPASQSTGASAGGSAAHHTSSNKWERNRLTRIFSVVLLFAVAVLLIAVAFSLFFGPGSSEGRLVDKKKLQAVFLNGGQVYFGNINALNEKYIEVSGIYYLRVNQQVQPNSSTTTSQDISLVKLGCELHGPTDTMVINREQVIFWENLKDDGQVAKAVAEYKKQNPNGQTCATSQTNTNQNTNTSNTTKKQ